MKTSFFLISFLICGNIVNAQTGKLGIGTTSPNSMMTVNGSVTAAYNKINASSYTMNANDFYVVYNGSSTGTITLPMSIIGGGTTAAVGYPSTGLGANLQGRHYFIKNATAAQTLTVIPSGTETIDGNASVTVSPGNCLQIISTGATSGITWEIINFAATTTSTGNTIYTGDGSLSGSRTVNQLSNNLLFNATSGQTYFRGNFSSLYRTHFQNVNIGANSRADIEISAGTTANSGLFMGVDNGSGIYVSNGAGLKGYIDNRSGGRLILGNNSIEQLSIATNGNVGIGNIAPNYPLDVTGDINASGSVRASGVALTSDVRLKRNIATLNDALTGILQLHPVSYEKKSSIASNDYNKWEMGLIAQELQKVYPQIVTVGTDINKTLAVDYNSLIALIVKAMQEQQAQIENLQKKIAILTAENEALKAKEMAYAYLAERVRQIEKINGINKKKTGPKVVKR